MKRLHFALILGLLPPLMPDCGGEDSPRPTIPQGVREHDRRALERAEQMREQRRRDIEQGPQTEPIPMPFGGKDEGSSNQ